MLTRSLKGGKLVLQNESMGCREIWSKRQWVLDNIENCCFQIYRSQGISYLSSIGGNYDIIWVGSIFTIKSDFCSNLKSNLDTPGFVLWCEFQINVDQRDCWGQGVPLGWGGGGSLWISMNIGSYKGNRVQVVNSAFRPCGGISPGVTFWEYGFFFGVLIKQISKTNKQ